MTEITPEQQAGLWNALLRSASAYHSYRRAQSSGFEPADVARFLIFDTRLPRSISFCAGEIQRMVGQLRGEYRLRNAQRAFDRVQRFQTDLRKVPNNADLLTGLHSFNDWVQRELMELTSELGVAFFGHQQEQGSTTVEAGSAKAANLFESQAGASGQIQTQG